MENLLKLSIFSFILLLGFSSCGDDDCEPGSLAETIVGTWSYTLASGSAEFQADGTLIDPDDIIFAFEVNGVAYDEKTWEIDSDGNLLVTASSGSLSSDATFPVTGFACDEVMITAFGFPLTLERE